MSAFEVTLADPRADEAHPAFSNLFVSAEWQAQHQAIVFARKPRLATDKGLLAANFLAGVEPAGAIGPDPGRPAALARPQSRREPSAGIVRRAAARALPTGAGATLDTGLDPVAAFAVRLQIAPKAKVQLTFCTAAADDPATLRAVIDKYRQLGNVERASLMSATLTGIRLREMRINAENFAAIQTLSTTLSLSLTRTHLRATEAGDVCDRRLLWRFGISGDRPIVLVSAGVAQGIGLLRSLAQALRLWSWGGIACDLVVINFEPTSYLMELNRSIAALKEQHAAAIAAQPGSAETGFHLLQASDLSADEVSTLRTLARVRFSADGRPLAHHVEEFAELHERAFQDRQAISCATLSGEMGAEIVPRRASGDFAAAGGEFRFDVNALMRPARPWVNVLANPEFGAQISEAGGGYSWALNSRLNMLTPWSNDAVADPAGEWFLLQDLRTMQAWSVTPSAAGDADSDYRVVHGQGYSIVSHRRGALDCNVTWCVDGETAVKQVRVRLVNRGHRTIQLRLVGIAEWILGAQRSDRASSHTRMATMAAAPASDDAPTSLDDGEGEARPRDRALLHPARPLGRLRRRHRVLRPRRRSRRPRRLDLRPTRDLRRPRPRHRPRPLRPGERLRPRPVRRALDPRHAARRRFARARVPARLRRQPGSGAKRSSPRPRWCRRCAACCRCGPAGTSCSARSRCERRTRCSTRWSTAGCSTRRSPAASGRAPASTRPAAPTAFATSCRTRWRSPGPRRRCCAGRSSSPPRASSPPATSSTGGMRRPAPACAPISPTTCSGCPTPAPTTWRRSATRACSTTSCPSSKARRSRKAPRTPTTCRRSATRAASVYEHCARAIDRSLKVGAHGLPLMGTGDWNDGMNRVGHEGRGESVWLGLVPVRRRAPLRADRRAPRRARARRALAGRGERLAAAPCRTPAGTASGIAAPSSTTASPLGSKANSECRIDLIAQAWAVLSGAAPEALARQAMASLERAADRPRRRPAAPARSAARRGSSRAPATSRRIRRGCARTAASTRTPASGR